LIQDNDVDDVASNNQQLYQSSMIPARFTIDVYKPFSDYLKLKYGEDRDAEDVILNKQKEFDYVFTLGTEQAVKRLNFEIYPILFEGKPPRKDVMDKLIKIAKEFQSTPGYPIIKSMSITNIVDRIMNSKDKRTKKKYHKCIQEYIGLPKELGNTDVTGFIERIPNEFLNTTSSSTSFQQPGVN